MPLTQATWTINDTVLGYSMPGCLSTALVYGASRLGCLRLHNVIYGQDDWTRQWQCAEKDAHAEKVDYGRMGRLLYGIGTFAHGS